MPEVGSDTTLLCRDKPWPLYWVHRIVNTKRTEVGSFKMNGLTSPDSAGGIIVLLPTPQPLCFAAVQPRYDKALSGMLFHISNYIQRGKCCLTCKHLAMRLTLYPHTRSNLAVRIVLSFFLWVFVCILSSYNAPYCAALFDSVDARAQIFTRRTVKWNNNAPVRPSRVVLWSGDRRVCTHGRLRFRQICFLVHGYASPHIINSTSPVT